MHNLHEVKLITHNLRNNPEIPQADHSSVKGERQNAKLTKLVCNECYGKATSGDDYVVFAYDCVKSATLSRLLITVKPDMTTATAERLVQESAQVTRVRHLSAVAPWRNPRMTTCGCACNKVRLIITIQKHQQQQKPHTQKHSHLALWNACICQCAILYLSR